MWVEVAPAGRPQVGLEVADGTEGTAVDHGHHSHHSRGEGWVHVAAPPRAGSVLVWWGSTTAS